VPPPTQNFLKSPFIEVSDAPFVLLAHPPTVLSCITLYERIGRGRTSSVWRADINSGVHMHYVAKMISAREIASIVRETLFYQNVFPQSALAPFVPKYYGTYASCDGAWYVIILEDVGTPVEDVNDFFSEEDEPVVRDLEHTFLAAGVEHRDIRPANVLRAADGRLRLIDFGYSMIVEPRNDFVH